MWTIRRLGSRELIQCWRSGPAEGAARGSVSAFRGRRATVGSSLEAGRPRLQQRLLGKHRGGVRLTGAAKRYPPGCRAGNGGRKQQPGSILAERSFRALAPRARQIPSVRALRRMRRNGSNAGLHVSLFGSNRGTCHSPCFHSSTEGNRRDSDIRRLAALLGSAPIKVRPGGCPDRSRNRPCAG